MKLSKKIGIYFSLVVLCMAGIVLLPKEKAMLLFLFLFFLLLSGGGYGIWFVKTLEHAIELIPDQKELSAYLARIKETTFRKMSDKEEELSREIEKQYSVKMEDKQSKINSLQSQINPHFLYNTLECIRSEAVCQGNKSIANMAKSLASFFRYSISRRENIVTIQDELNNIENYIVIQNYRFDDKFCFQVDVQEADRKYLTCLIPKMTIQPIVENAIFHGLETKTGDCRVIIRMRVTQYKIILTITDNGIGMNEMQLKNLRDSLEYGNIRERTDMESAEKRVHGNGIALYNINQRLKLTFGEEYCIHVYSIEGEGTDVEILLPIRTELEKE